MEFIPEYRSEATATEAKAICAGCTVRDAYLTEALSDPQLIGIWAGTTSAERKQNAAAACCLTFALHPITTRLTLH